MKKHPLLRFAAKFFSIVLAVGLLIVILLVHLIQTLFFRERDAQ